MKIKWTHKIVHKDRNEWWFGALIGRKFYHNGLHEEYEKAGRDVIQSFDLDMSIEEFYNKPKYEVNKLSTFKGNV